MESWAEQIPKNKSIVPLETLRYKFNNSQLLTACWLTCAHRAPLCSHCLWRAFATQVIFPTEHCGEQNKLFSLHNKSELTCMAKFNPVWDTGHIRSHTLLVLLYMFYFILIRLLYFKSKAKYFPHVARISEVGFFLPFSLECTSHVLLQARAKERKKYKCSLYLVPKMNRLRATPSRHTSIFKKMSAFSWHCKINTWAPLWIKEIFN